MDWIIQFDPPDDTRDYIHRVGRTARGKEGKGRSLMFLQPSEVGFLKHLKEARVPVVEFEFPASKIVNVQSQLEKLIGQNYYLNKVRPFSSSLSPSPPLSPSFVNSILTNQTVRKRRLSRLPPSVRLPLPPLRLRRPQTRSRQSSQGLRFPSTSPHRHPARL